MACIVRTVILPMSSFSTVVEHAMAISLSTEPILSR
ncbi:Uncharacterised protein [Vibrio cholerae]|nr:Uncharacterised protein [Vibrio cholerae]